LRFVDVDRGMRLRIEDLESKITKRTRVVYVIHYLGFPQPIEEIQALCRRHGLILFEDCALAFGSSLDGRPLGSFGDLAIFCLPKFLPVPNGGILVLNDPNLRLPPPVRAPSRYSVASQQATKLLDHLDTHGGRWGASVRRVLTRAARRLVGTAGLRRVDSGVMEFLPDKVDWGMSRISGRILARIDYERTYHKRRRNYLALQELVRDLPGIAPLKTSLPEGACPLFFPVLVEDNQLFARELISRRISGGGFWNWFPPGVPVDAFPDTVFLRTHVLELQIHQDLERKHLEATARALESIVQKRP
jgi:dTDP-4-amino-4,6-dideoxygalactose transaminase